MPLICSYYYIYIILKTKCSTSLLNVIYQGCWYRNSEGGRESEEQGLWAVLEDAGGEGRGSEVSWDWEGGGAGGRRDSSALRTREDTGRRGLRSQEAVDPLLSCICLLFVFFLDLHWRWTFSHLPLFLFPRLCPRQGPPPGTQVSAMPDTALPDFHASAHGCPKSSLSHLTQNAYPRYALYGSTCFFSSSFVEI